MSPDMTPEQLAQLQAIGDEMLAEWQAKAEQRAIRLEPLYDALEREARLLLVALYDATDTNHHDDLQAWFDARVGGTDARYLTLIARLRQTLRELAFARSTP